MCQHLRAPTLNQTLHNTIAMRCCTDLAQNDTMFKQFWLFMVKSQPHLILQKCAVILAIDCHTNWHRMIKYKSILAEECDQHNFQNQMSVPCNFFLGNIWAHHSEFWHFSWRSNECIHDLSTVKIWLTKYTAFIYPCCWWVEARRTHTWFFGHHRVLVESTLHRLFVSLSCWSGYGTFAGQILTFVATVTHIILCICSRTNFTCSTLHSSVANVGAPLTEASSVFSWPFLMAFTHWWTVSYEGAWVPRLSFNL